MARITVTISSHDRKALEALGQRQRRNPRDQAAFLLTEALRAAGAYEFAAGDAEEGDRMPGKVPI